MKPLVKLLTSFALPFGAGLIGSLITLPAIPTWYAELAKPWFTPANWLFGPVWTCLYLFLGIALYRIWSRNVASYLKQHQQRTVMIFIVHLGINALWSLAFFGFHSPALGLLTIIILLAMIVSLVKLCYPLDRLASWLLIPYVLWVAFATLLNGAIWYLN